jgi:hypothetical protein
VLGNGFAFGCDVPPGPGGVAGVLSGGFCAGDCGNGAVAQANTRQALAIKRSVAWFMFILSEKFLKSDILL